MKRALFIFIFAVCMAMVSACAAQSEVLHMGLNAVITDMDTQAHTLTVKDAGGKEVFGEDCVIDCSETYILYVDYDTREIKDLDLEDLQTGDDIILSVYDSQLSLMEKGTKTIKADQVQLGTQRMN